MKLNNSVVNFKKEIINKISKKHKIYKQFSKDIVDEIFEELYKSINKYDEVKINKFGTFKKINYNAKLFDWSNAKSIKKVIFKQSKSNRNKVKE